MRLIHVVEGAWLREKSGIFLRSNTTKMVDILRGLGPGVMKLYNIPKNMVKFWVGRSLIETPKKNPHEMVIM